MAPYMCFIVLNNRSPFFLARFLRLGQTATKTAWKRRHEMGYEWNFVSDTLRDQFRFWICLVAGARKPRLSRSLETNISNHH